MAVKWKLQAGKQATVPGMFSRGGKYDMLATQPIYELLEEWTEANIHTEKRTTLICMCTSSATFLIWFHCHCPSISTMTANRWSLLTTNSSLMIFCYQIFCLPSRIHSQELRKMLQNWIASQFFFWLHLNLTIFLFRLWKLWIQEVKNMPVSSFCQQEQDHFKPLMKSVWILALSKNCPQIIFVFFSMN